MIKRPRTYAAVRQALLQRYGRAPVKLDGIVEATEFYARHAKKVPIDKVESECRAIDFSRPVTVKTFPAGTRLQTFAKLYPCDDGKTVPGLGDYYTQSGVAPSRLGISTRGRHSVRVKTTGEIVALVSYTTGVKDTWSDKSKSALVDGGGLQIRLADDAKAKLRFDSTFDISNREH